MQANSRDCEGGLPSKCAARCPVAKCAPYGCDNVHTRIVNLLIAERHVLLDNGSARRSPTCRNWQGFAKPSAFCSRPMSLRFDDKANPSYSTFVETIVTFYFFGYIVSRGSIYLQRIPLQFV